MKRLFLFLLAVLFCCPHQALSAGMDTSFRFATIETPHFSIYFHQGLEPLARRAATLAEEIHPEMTALFQWEPREKTQLVLVDDSDFANGMTTVLPFNAIRLQTVPPSADSTIGDYDDWLRTLLVHEYSHVLTSDPARGYSTVMRSIFGKPAPLGDLFSLVLLIATGPPNVFMPHWWHEGMATWGETVLTSRGRGRSSYHDMIVRAAVAENTLPTLDKINGEVPYWPSGNLPYIFGLQLMEYIAGKYGNQAMGDLSKAQSGRFPYFITGPPEQLFQEKDYVNLYADMLAQVKEEQSAHLTRLKELPLTPTTRLGKVGGGETNPRFSPDGRLMVFNRSDQHGHPTVVITERDGKTVRAEFRRLPSDGGLSWTPDGKKLVFSQAEIWRGFDVYQDLYQYDLQEDRVRRLTRGLRGSEPDVSPDGTRVAVIISHRGDQNLALLDLAELPAHGDKPSPKMLTDYRQFRVASPRWAPDGSAIAYTLTDNAGVSSLNLYNVRTGTNQELFSGQHNITSPSWTRDGSRILFSGDGTGVYNIYAYSPAEQKTEQLSHLLGGAFQPDMSPDNATIVFSGYHAKGFTIETMAGNRPAWSADRSPAIDTNHYPLNPARDAATRGVTVPSELPAQPYSSLSTLAPRFWLPALISDTSNSTAGGVLTAGQDVLGYHSYLAQLLYGPKFKKLYYNLLYQNAQLYPTFTLQTYAQPVLYSNLLRRGDYYELNRGLIAKAAIPLNYLESRLRFALGYQLQDQQPLSRLTTGAFNGLRVFTGRRDNLFAELTYSDSLKYPWSVSHEEGRNASVLFKYYGPESGSTVNAREYTATLEQFFHLPKIFLPHQVLFARLAGGLADGERIPQQAFQLGGLPSFLNPFALRGYPDRSEAGKYVATGTLEHRFPAWFPLRGFGSKPLFLDRLHGAAFADLGEAWDDNRSFRLSRLKVGAGLEARLDVTIGYWLKVTPAIGVAHGFNQGGEDRLYVTIYANL